jgi:hypothetical protein
MGEVVMYKLLVCVKAEDYFAYAWFYNSFFERLLGLTVRRNQPLCAYFPRCCSVHTFGMRLPIDIAFLDIYGTVRIVHLGVPPNRMVTCTTAVAVIERIHCTEPWFRQGSQVVLSKVV